MRNYLLKVQRKLRMTQMVRGKKGDKVGVNDDVRLCVGYGGRPDVAEVSVLNKMKEGLMPIAEQNEGGIGTNVDIDLSAFDVLIDDNDNFCENVVGTSCSGKVNENDGDSAHAEKGQENYHEPELAVDKPVKGKGTEQQKDGGVIRVKWSLHAREEIIFELLQHLRGNAARSLLEGIQKSTREMIDEQEAVRGRLFTIQDVIQGTVRAWLQDRSLRVTHNLAVFGGCGLVLSIFTGLFGINVDGIPGASTPYAFVLFSAILFFLGIVLIAVGLLYFGLKQPITEKQVEVRKLELQELVKMFQHEAETHAQVYNKVSRDNLPPTTSDKFPEDADYILIN
ncbi:hypothetical protein U1Q18_010416 [Sarracenia purpurea var. burkii]